jgi:tetratricopeptide (TPR) repeat protein
MECGRDWDVRDMRQFLIACMAEDFETAQRVYAALNQSDFTGEKPGVSLELIETLEPGRPFAERLSEYIQEELTDLVLLWSWPLARSTWIRWEFNDAQQMRLEDLGISLRLFQIDDIAMPRSARHYIVPIDVRNEIRNPALVARALLMPPPEPARPRRILDRGEESEAIEKAFYSSRTRTLWLWGVAGVGKRSIALEMATRLRLLSRTRQIEVRPDTGRTELDILIAAELGVEAQSPSHEGQPLWDEALLKVRGDTFALITNLMRVGGIWIFSEAQYWLDDNAEPVPILGSMLDACNDWSFSASQRLIIFTSRRKPTLRQDWLGWSELKRVGGLPRFYAVQLLQERGSHLKEQDLHKVAQQLAGHALALEIAARELTTVPPDWDEERVRLAAELIAGAPLSTNARAVLEVVAAVDAPLAGEEIGRHLNLSSERYREAVDEAISYSLLDVDADGFLECHELVGEYFFRELQKREDYATRMSDLADRMAAFEHTLPQNTPVRARALLSAFRLLAQSYRFDESQAVRSEARGVLYAAGQQLYRDRRYDEALDYFEKTLSMPSDMSDETDVRLRIAQCLSHLDRINEARRIVDMLLEDLPADRNVLRVRGRIEANVQNWRPAERYYSLALRAGRPFAALYRDRGQARMQLGHWDEARRDLEESIGLDSTNGFAYFHLAQVLMRMGEVGPALRAIERSLALEPNNGLFRTLLERVTRAVGSDNRPG